MGRPSDYNQETADRICLHLAEGKSLRSFCALDGSPGQSTIYRWLAANPQFREQYARAREEQAETFVDEMMEIADTEEDSQKARVRIDTRKWVAARMQPKKYGDRISTEVTGKDGGPIETASVELTETERARRVAFILTNAAKANGHDKTA